MVQAAYVVSWKQDTKFVKWSMVCGLFFLAYGLLLLLLLSSGGHWLKG